LQEILPMKTIVYSLIVALSMVLAGVSSRAEDGMLAHDVYFSLKDNSPQAKAKLITACKKYLSDHPGTVWFAAGPLASELKRDVNDQDFDVALHIVFKNKAAHDVYAKAERHLKSIEENKDTWKKVRVFDSFVAVSSHGTLPQEQAKQLGLPDAATGFAGMIQGAVTKQHGDGFVLKVATIAETWKHSKAKNPKSLIGRAVAVDVRQENGKPAKDIARFVKSLKTGERVVIDVAHQEKGEALTILELTEEQRKRVKE
jgi:hypothetical protein